jgi:filamentous hemagglutinin family protein
MRINGGERTGNNLFYSFEEFLIPEGKEAVFENATEIENIFTRITGESISNIDGILKTQGGANFFLVNPKGIIFGKNAQLDVGGSFIATTANSIQFEGATEFAANSSTSEQIITMDRAIGLNFGGNNGSIQVNGNGSQIISDTKFSPINLENSETSLSVKSGKILALVGGEITFPGGIVCAEGGRIEISSINSGLVSFQNTESELTLNYDGVVSYQDITLSKQALLDTSGEGEGAISLTGNNILLSRGSFLLNQNRGNIDSGSININALKSLTVSGASVNGEIASSIRSESLSSGKGAKFNLTTRQLRVFNEAQISTSSHSEASGNELNINASDSIEIVDSSFSASTYAKGNAGNINLATSHLQVKDGAGITSSTIANGNGGNVTVNADLIEIAGVSSGARANISASSFNIGNAGNLIIDTEQLKVQDGGSISSSAFAQGNAGNVNVQASKSVEVSGIDRRLNISTPESTIRSAVQAASPRGQQALRLPAVPTGNSGNLTINTPSLRVERQGVVSVQNQGTGSGGTLSINAEQVNLSEAGRITAASASGTGGNINLKTDQLHLDENSTITATAENNGDGGNVTINTTALLAKKREYE